MRLLIFLVLPCFSGTGNLPPALGKGCRAAFGWQHKRPYPTTKLRVQTKELKFDFGVWLVTSKSGKCKCGFSTSKICMKDIPYQQEGISQVHELIEHTQ